MNYLVPMFDCEVYDEKIYGLKAKVKYKISCDASEKMIVFSNHSLPFIFSLNDESEQIVKVKHSSENFYFLFPNIIKNAFFTSFNFRNKKIDISLSGELSITIEGTKVLKEDVFDVSFSHYEVVGDLCLVYFVGARNYLVVIKEGVEFANYYDECNVNENEKYFMCRFYDSLNHGLVCHIKEKELKTYLVYLDDEELNLKSEFVCCVFLDCLKAGNFKYCNEMLCEELKLKDSKDIKEFFPQFDFFYPINEREFILLNKNTLAGIYKFETKDNLITNIVKC